MERLRASRLLNIDPEMVQEIATGLEDGAEIASRYGFSPAEWEQLASNQIFQRQVKAAIAEREKSGKNFRTKAAVMAEKLMDDMFRSALGVEVPVKDKAAALQVLTRVGELEPRREVDAAASGPAFSISISVPQISVAEEAVSVKITKSAEDAEDAVVSLPFGEDEEEEDVRDEKQDDDKDR